MYAQIMELFTASFAAVVGWFSQIMNGSGLATFFVGMFVVWASMKYLLGPLVFNAGSDRAKDKSKEV